MLKTTDVSYFKPNVVLSTFAQDTSGRKAYCFNSLGYRGVEYDHEAQLRVFVFGCSHTFVNGLNWEEGFPTIFAVKLAEHLQISEEELNIMNFSAGGHSTDYSVRTLYRQCERVSPDFILFDLSPLPRIEFVNKEGRAEFFCPAAPSLTEDALRFYDFYTPEMGFLSCLKNILLVQSFCVLRKIPYLIHYRHVPPLERFQDLPCCADYIAHIEWGRVCSTSSVKRVDFAADKRIASDGTVLGHEGPVTNALLAERLFEHYIAHPSPLNN